VAARQQKPIVGTSSPFRKTIRVSSEERVSQGIVRDMRGAVVAKCVARDALKFLRDPANAHFILRAFRQHRAPRRYLRRAATINENPCEARMKWNALQLPAEGGDAWVFPVCLNGLEPLKQTER
jgi:hypothetical protein